MVLKKKDDGKIKSYYRYQSYGVIVKCLEKCGGLKEKEIQMVANIDNYYFLDDLGKDEHVINVILFST